MPDVFAPVTTRRIEDLASEVGQETGQNFAGFRADVISNALDVTFSWTRPVLKTIHVRISDQDTDATVKAAIRDQLTPHGV